MRLLEYGGGTFQLHAGLLGEERRAALVSGPIRSCDHINITQSITSSREQVVDAQAPHIMHTHVLRGGVCAPGYLPWV